MRATPDMRGDTELVAEFAPVEGSPHDMRRTATDLGLEVGEVARRLGPGERWSPWCRGP